jgi:hypothetical protein
MYCQFGGLNPQKVRKDGLFHIKLDLKPNHCHILIA